MMVKWVLGGLIFFLMISLRIVHSEPNKPLGDIERGKNIFASKCAFCHYTDKMDTRVGPGLKGIFKRTVLPVSKRPVTRETIRNQIKNPFANMPAIPDLSEQDIRDITEYLRML